MKKEEKLNVLDLCDEQNKNLCTLKNIFELRKQHAEKMLETIEKALDSLSDVVKMVQDLEESS